MFDNHYGTARAQVEKHLADGNSVILEIDWQGARQVRESMPSASRSSSCRRRSKNSSGACATAAPTAKRSSSAACATRVSDMGHWDEFDYVIINDDLDQAVDRSRGRARRRGRGHVDRATNGCAAPLSRLSLRQRRFITFGYMGWSGAGGGR